MNNNSNDRISHLDIKIGMIFLLSLLAMVGCANQPLKAPCDHHATFCGAKTKINHW